MHFSHPASFNKRLAPFATSVFDTMTSLARQYDAINLGQGIPDIPAPQALTQAAIAAIEQGNNQYPPARGYQVLREAITAQIAHDYGIAYDPSDECIVTVGATEALAVALMSTCEPGDEVIVFEPFYDSYAAILSSIGATLIPVPLYYSDGRWNYPINQLASLITPATKAVLLNSPHNPTGAVINYEECVQLAQVIQQYNLIAICDEVYEHFTYGCDHLPLASFPGMIERTLRISSAAKTFNVTGWKIGWITGSSQFITHALTLKQHYTFGSGAPFQLAIAHVMAHETAWIAQLCAQYASNKDILTHALIEQEAHVYASHGGYFLVARIPYPGWEEGYKACMLMPEKLGIAALPLTSFTVNYAPWSGYIRFSFAKDPATLARAIAQLQHLSQ